MAAVGTYGQGSQIYYQQAQGNFTNEIQEACDLLKDNKWEELATYIGDMPIPSSKDYNVAKSHVVLVKSVMGAIAYEISGSKELPEETFVCKLIEKKFLISAKNFVENLSAVAVATSPAVFGLHPSAATNLVTFDLDTSISHIIKAMMDKNDLRSIVDFIKGVIYEPLQECAIKAFAYAITPSYSNIEETIVQTLWDNGFSKEDIFNLVVGFMSESSKQNSLKILKTLQTQTKDTYPSQQTTSEREPLTRHHQNNDLCCNII